MKKGYIISILCLLLLTVTYYASALDNPHDTSNTMSCPSCHVIYGTSPSWYTEAPDPGNPDSNYPYNRLCWSCHSSPLKRTHSNFVINGSEDWTRECRECHNPHYQRQYRAWGSPSYLATGNATTVTNTTIYASGANWSTNQWQGRVVLGNINYPNYAYRITSNTANNLTVLGTMNARYVTAGSTFAIVYGKGIKEDINAFPVKFFTNEGNNSFADGGSTYDGVCEVCHTATTYYKNDGSGSAHSEGPPGANCTQCHPHVDGFAPTAGCTGCHGYPPISTSTLVTSPNPTNSTIVGAHDLHYTTKSISCASCHVSSVGSGSKHNEAPNPPQNVTIGFSLFNGTYSGGIYNGQSNVIYDSSEVNTTVTRNNSLTCNNIYCHGKLPSGSVWGGGTNTTPAWNATVVNCGDCHLATNANPPTTANHQRHAGNAAAQLSLGCTACHNNYTSVHVNNQANVAFSNDSRVAGGSYNGTTTMFDAYGSCSNIYCHSNIQANGGGSGPTSYNTPQWNINATVNCASGDCHGFPVTSGNHTKHSNSGYLCDRCHWGAGDATSKHADYNIDIIFNPPYNYTNGNYSQSPNTPGGGYGTCNNLYCHSIVQTSTGGPLTGAGGQYKTPTWGSSPLACSDCHGNPAASGAHAEHATTYGYNCKECHYGYVPPLNTTSHVNGSINVAINSSSWFNGTYNGNATPGQGFSNCSNTYCHSAGTGWTLHAGDPRSVTNNTSPAWGNTTNCGSCHGGGASSGRPNYGNATKANSHTNVAKHAAMSCDKCHNLTTTTGNTVTNASLHVNRYYNVDGTGSQPYTLTYAYNATGGTCSASYCHGASAIKWGATSSLTCASCHSSMGAGGANAFTGMHNTHVNATGYDYSCEMCHAQGSTGTSVSHANGPVVVGNQSAEIVFRNVTTAWQTGQTYNNSTSTYKYISLGHNPYNANSTVTPSYNSTGAVQTDGGLNWRNAGTCSNVWCHSNAYPLNATNSYQASLAWNTTINCGSCHSKWNDVSTSWSLPHDKHVKTYYANANVTCNSCHASTASDNTVIASKTWHVNAEKNVSYNSFVGSGTYNATTYRCSNTYCHSIGTSATGNHTAITWAGTMAADCTSCHAGTAGATTRMATSGHNAHINDTANQVSRNIDCVECHKATISSNTTVSNVARHVNKLYNVQFDNVLNKDTDSPTYNGNSTTGADGATKGAGGAVASCNNVYCHSVGNLNASTGTVVAGGGVSFRNVTWNAALTCSGCHGDQSTKAHPVYATGGGNSTTANSHVEHVESSAYNCQTCHISTTANSAIPPTSVVAGGAHLNRVENVSFNTTVAGNATWAGGAKVCSTTLCHGTSSPAWGATTSNYSCTKCHGNPTVTVSLYKSAPGADTTGVDTAGNTGNVTSRVSDDIQVGAHDVHVRATNNYSSAISCSECHVVPGAASSAGHLGSLPAEITWGNLSTLNSTYSPSWAGGGGACTSTYCHGVSLADGTTLTKVTPDWNTSMLNGTGGIDCGRCHGNPPNTSGHATGVSANQCQGCHSHALNGAVAPPFFNNLALHLNGVVDGGGSTGGSACYACHTYQSAMEDGVGSKTGATRTSWYHHVMGNNTAQDGDIAPNTGTYPTNTTTLYCVSCHTDHNYFNSNKGANLRSAISAAGSSIANTDYNATSPYGICVSCHNSSLTKDTANQKNNAWDGNTTTAIDGALYNNGGHQYNVNSTFGASVFSANCAKCHTDEQTKEKQTSATKFGTHYSNYSRLLSAFNMTSPADPLEENFCFKCHSNSNEALKPTADKDYYGVANMTANSQRLYNNFATVRGTATAASTTSITDSSKNWGAGTWGNYSVTILNGTYSGNMRRITSNNGTVLNVSTQFEGTPVVGTKYQIGGVHGVVDSNGSHKPVEGTAAGWMPNATRHVECEDCHNPHAASPGTSWAYGNVTAAAANTVTIQGPASGKTWPNDRWKYYTITVRNATANGQVRYIAGNTGNTLTIVGNWSVTPTTSFNYTMRSSTFADGGVATGGSATTLVDTTRAGNWTANQWAGYYVKVMSGTGREQVRKITANTNQNLTVASWTATAAGAGYVIYRPPAIAGANNGITNVVDVNFDTAGSMRNVTYSAKTTAATTQYELCLKCHSTWAFTNENTVRLPSSYPAGPNANWSTGLNATDIGRDFDPDNYGYHPLFAPGKHQPIRMGDPSGNFVNGTIAYNSNWPNQVIVNATRINATSGSAIIRANANTTFSPGIGAGYWIFIGNNTPPNPANSTWAGRNRGWWPIASRNSNTTITLAVPYTYATVNANASYITKGFKSTFVDGWGPESLVTCTDCHSTTGTSYANGPHGSTNRWMLRNQEPQTVSNITSVVNVTTVTNPFNFCLNCHSKNVYGDVAPAATTYAAGPNSNWGRITHTGWNDCIEDSQADRGAGNHYHINCMNCHSGGDVTSSTVNPWPGSLHGSSQGLAPNNSAATTPRGFRFMNGAAWNGHTVGLTASTCYTAEVAASVSSCSSHDTGSNPATPNFRY